MIKIELHENEKDNSAWWNNFLNTRIGGADFPNLAEFKRILKADGGELKVEYERFEDNPKYFLEFESPEDLNVFILKWS